VFQDLTDIKQLESQVRLKEKLAAVGEMAAQLAHEIRNPLGSISGSAQVLLSEPKISEDQRRLLEIITRESTRLSATLNQFLHQSRPSTAPAEPVDIGPVLAEAVTLLRNSPEVGEAREVRFVADPGPHLCRANPDQIVQVFWNLARNGLEAMPDGGRLQVRLRCEGEELVLTVRDQGRGIGRDDQGRMFEPFQSGSAMGTGLGLAIVYRIVKEHRGDIRVRTMPGRGTQVDVRLPLIPVPVVA
jgi:two-component system sensor histidine kinase PilS (NtrC family)